MRETFPQHSASWQVGYGAFGVGRSGVARTIRYIENQYEHHCGRTFEEEYLKFLEDHGIESVPRGFQPRGRLRMFATPSPDLLPSHD